VIGMDLSDRFLRQAWHSGLNLFLKVDCLLCGRSNEKTICLGCHQQLCEGARARPLDMMDRLPVFTWGSYEGGLKRVIWAMKYDGQRQVGNLLGQLLGKRWKAHGLPQLTLVPIPMYEEKRQQRGYNQADLIAQGVARITNHTIAPKLLVRSRSTVPQWGLSMVDRQENLRSAFVVAPHPGPKPQILLVDDIYTTGATAVEAQRSLVAAGFKVWGIAVVAR
jgi:ComF family protein